MGFEVAELDRLEPGPELVAALGALDWANLSAYDRVTVLKAHQRLASHFQALAYQDMESIYSYFSEFDGDAELSWDSAAAEIGAALHLTRRSAERELETAVDLYRRLPQVGVALAAGRIDLRRAKTFAFATVHLDDGAARDIVAQSLGRAERMTAGQLEAYLRRQALAHDPDSARKRYRQALADRQVILAAQEAGTAHLHGYHLPPDLAARALERICRLAETARTPGDTRTVDQLRADVFLDLLLGPQPDRAGGVVNIHVDLATLTRLNEEPGELAGYGPVIADIARQVAEQQSGGEWRFTLEDPQTGLALTNGITRRRPTAAQRRAVEAKNPTCIYPGCRTPASRCDLDHRREYAKGGPTQVSNLAPFCEHHHNLRHGAGWTYEPLPGGDYLFTSRLGHQYTTSGRSP